MFQGPAPSALKLLADLFDPLLALLALVMPVWKMRDFRAQVPYYVALGMSLACVYAIKAVDDHFRIWPSFGLDYSTHTAFAVCMGASLGWVRPGWGLAIVAAILGYAALIVYLGFHSVADIATTAPIVAALTLSAHYIMVRSVRSCL